MIDPRDKVVLERVFRAAIAASDPAACVRRYLPDRPRGRTVVVGAGKAAAQMAEALVGSWDGPLEGVVVTGPVMPPAPKLVRWRCSRPAIPPPTPPRSGQRTGYSRRSAV